MTAPVLVDRRDAVVIVTLNRPDRRNGVTMGMCVELHAALEDIARSDAMVVVLHGAGKDFSVGADMGADVGADRGADGDAESDKSAASASLPRPGDHAIYHASTLLHSMPQVTIAAVDGGCAGAGMGWATACDLRIGTARSRWSTAFLNVGVSGDMGLPWSLARLVGSSRARELLFFPDRFDGERAHALGILSRLVAPEALLDDALAMAQSLAGRDPMALRLLKANCLSAETLPIDAYIEAESARHIETIARPELRRLMAEGYARRHQR